MSTVVKKGKVMADHIDSYVVSVLNTEAMDNGSQVVLGTPVANQLGVYNCTKPTDVTKQDVYMVLSQLVPKLVVNGVEYRIDLSDPSQFTNVANFPALAFKVSVGDEFTVSAAGFSAAPTVSTATTPSYVIPANTSYLLAPAADLTGGTTIAYQVIASEPISVGMGFIDGYRIRCIKAV